MTASAPADRLPPLPNFLVLGAPKCGTTSLHAYLRQHPDVFLPEEKEVIFFEAEYERGLAFYRQRYFEGWSGEAAVGEVSCYKLYLPFVPARIHESLDGVRLVAVLREPGERAYSHWWHRYARRTEHRSFREVVESDAKDPGLDGEFTGAAGAQTWRKGIYPGTVTPRKLNHLALGCYAEQLGRYLDLFPASRIEIVLFEDLSRDPEAVVRRLWAFLRVDPGHPLTDSAPRNVRSGVRDTLAWAYLFRANEALRFSRLLPESARRFARGLLAGRKVDQPPMDVETRRFLDAFFAERNRKLEALIGRDLTAWRRSAH
jgi:Sulfotransferase domain